MMFSEFVSHRLGQSQNHIPGFGCVFQILNCGNAMTDGLDTIIAAVAQAYPQQRETRGTQAKEGGTVISEQHTMKTPAKYWPTEAA